VKIEDFLETLENQQTSSVTSPLPRLKLGSEKRQLLTVEVNDCIDAIERLSPAIISVGISLTFDKKLTHWRLCTGVLNYLSSWEEFYLELDDGNVVDLPVMPTQYDSLGIAPRDSWLETSAAGFEIAYQKLLNDLCEEIQSIISHGKDKRTTEDFDFMSNYFHSQIEWPSNDEIRAETNSVDCSKDSESYTTTYTQEDLIEYVDNQLLSAKQIIPALTYMGKMFENFQAHLLNEKINTAVLNYFLAVTELREDTEKWPDIYHEFSKLGIFKMFEHQRTDLTFCLDQAAEWLIENRFENIEENLEGINLTLENCNFMSEYFKENALWDNQKPESGSNIISFPSGD
jgi:hypothetical protein